MQQWWCLRPRGPRDPQLVSTSRGQLLTLERGSWGAGGGEERTPLVQVEGWMGRHRATRSGADETFTCLLMHGRSNLAHRQVLASKASVHCHAEDKVISGIVSDVLAEGIYAAVPAPAHNVDAHPVRGHWTTMKLC